MGAFILQTTTVRAQDVSAVTLIKHRIQTLMLNLDAAYPSQARDAKQMIKDWRHSQRMHLVPVTLGEDQELFVSDISNYESEQK